MSAEELKGLVQGLTRQIAGRPLDAELAAYLNRTFSGESVEFKAIEALCHKGVAEGWMCQREAGGIRYGRVLPPDDGLAGFSVDVVHMTDVAGPHHRHPEGEIDMVMPISPDARFDGTPRGWKVYGPDTAHRPTVTGGTALVLYLLPGGQIEFTR
jgi:hypothetical protein